MQAEGITSARNMKTQACIDLSVSPVNIVAQDGRRITAQRIGAPVYPERSEDTSYSAAMDPATFFRRSGIAQARCRILRKARPQPGRQILKRGQLSALASRQHQHYCRSHWRSLPGREFSRSSGFSAFGTSAVATTRRRVAQRDNTSASHNAVFPRSSISLA